MEKNYEIDTRGLRTWVEIETKKIANNYRLFRGILGKKTVLMSVVKSNAYGHGLVPFAREMERLGADWIGVDSITEALRLRREKIKTPMLVLGHTLSGRLTEAVIKKISITVSNKEILKACAALSPAVKKKLRFHIKIETGMGRQGFLSNEIPRVISYSEKNNLTHALEGVYTHFAQAKNPSFPHATRIQLAEFEKVRGMLARSGLTPIVHAAATSGTLLFPESHFDMVRIGIGMYGLWPSREVRAVYGDRIPLKPVLSWKTLIGEVNKLPKGAGVGYDHTEKLVRNSKIAVCPVGYWHGYTRALSSTGHVLVRGRRARVIGRVSMDMLVIDVTDIPRIRAGDAVSLIGGDKRELVTADELGVLSGTVNYEIITRINPLIYRRYV